MSFFSWMKARYQHPVVVVSTSSSVEDSMRCNNCDFITFLRSFSVYPSSLTARTGEHGEGAISTTQFGVRLVRYTAVRPVEEGGIVQYIQQHLESAILNGEEERKKEMHSFFQSIVKESGQLNEDGQSSGRFILPIRVDPLMSTVLQKLSHAEWQTDFVRDYVYLTRCSHIDTIDHPVGIIYVASTHEGNKVEDVLREFKSQLPRWSEIIHQMPCMDSDVHVHFFLVHDAARGIPFSIAEDYLNRIKMEFKTPNCDILVINSLAREKESLPSTSFKSNSDWKCLDVDSEAYTRESSAYSFPQGNLYGSTPMVRGVVRKSSLVPYTTTTTTTSSSSSQVKVHASPTHTTGGLLSEADVSRVREVMFHYLSYTLFNFLEKKLAFLTNMVNERKTTTFSKVAAWFKSKDDIKPRPELFASPGKGLPVQYYFDSLEMQMRRAGDLSMVLQDFEMAQKFYRLCKNELKETLEKRSFNHLMVAACYEGIGIAQIFTGKLAFPNFMQVSTSFVPKSTKECPLEVARIQYLQRKASSYAFRSSLILFEYCRISSISNANFSIEMFRNLSSIVNGENFYHGILYEIIANSCLLLSSPQVVDQGFLEKKLIRMQAHSHLRRHVYYLAQAARAYEKGGYLKMALRCQMWCLDMLKSLHVQHSWVGMAGSIVTSIMRLNRSLDWHLPAIAYGALAVRSGVPVYRDETHGLHNFKSFWSYLKDVLHENGMASCRRMPLPVIPKLSILVSRNHYHSDANTEGCCSAWPRSMVEMEWKSIEGTLKNTYNNLILKDYTKYRFPHYCGSRLEDFLFSRKNDTSKRKKMELLHSFDDQTSMIRHYCVPLAEILYLTFKMHNPVGGPILAEDLCILYLSSKQGNTMLKKSELVQSVELKAGEMKQIALSFCPNEEGEYTIVGLSWFLLGQEGHWYFTESDITDANVGESVFSANPDFVFSNLGAEKNVKVTVLPPRAWITAELSPPLPSVMYDGQYFHSELKIINNSSCRDAVGIAIQRSPRNTHIVWFERFGMQQNLETEAAFLIPETLHAGETLSIPIVLRAQHNRDASQESYNNLFLLIGYLTDSTFGPDSPRSSMNISTGDGAADWQAVPSPISCNPMSTVRLHRFLRTCVVKPLLSLHSSVLPPSNALLGTGVMLKIQNISRHQYTPVRVARVLALHRCNWDVQCQYPGSLLDDNGMDCLLGKGGTVCVAMSISAQKCDGSLRHKTDSGDAHTAEPAERNESLRCERMMDTECLPFARTLPSSKQRAVMLSIVGGPDLSTSQMSQYFIRNSYHGSGKMGEDDNSGEIVFYHDKKGHEQETLAERKLLEVEKEIKVYGAPLVQYSPVLFAVSWVVGDSETMTSGQSFIFVDVREFASPTGSSYEKTIASYSKRQREFCSFLVVNQSVHPHFGIFIYNVSVSPLETSKSTSDSAIVSVNFRCLSMAHVPLLIYVRGGSLKHMVNHFSHVPLVFVGKTRMFFVIMPCESYELNMVAHILSPGIVNCNVFEVNAALLPCHVYSQLFTGMTLNELINQLKPHKSSALNSIPNQYTDPNQFPRRSSITTSTSFVGASLGSLTPSTEEDEEVNSLFAQLGVKKAAPGTLRIVGGDSVALWVANAQSIASSFTGCLPQKNDSHCIQYKNELEKFTRAKNEFLKSLDPEFNTEVKQKSGSLAFRPTIQEAPKNVSHS